MGNEVVLLNAPAGEQSRDARVVAISRLLLVAKLRRGVPLEVIAREFDLARQAENALLTEQIMEV